MRLGWDHGSINAPELARRADAAGVKMITVHGRTRCQFYGGRADWSAIRWVREAVTVPLIANGDSATPADAAAMLEASGADGIMIGRGAYGRPWWPGVIADCLDPGNGIAEPSLAQEADIVASHHAAILEHYGEDHGNRIARKHIGWTIERLLERRHIDAAAATDWRARLLRTSDNRAVSHGLTQLYERIGGTRAAA
jgi:tRNA-dihydrouridine synthase